MGGAWPWIGGGARAEAEKAGASRPRWSWPRWATERLQFSKQRGEAGGVCGAQGSDRPFCPGASASLGDNGGEPGKRPALGQTVSRRLEDLAGHRGAAEPLAGDPDCFFAGAAQLCDHLKKVEPREPAGWSGGQTPSGLAKLLAKHYYPPAVANGALSRCCGCYPAQTCCRVGRAPPPTALVSARGFPEEGGARDCGFGPRRPGIPGLGQGRGGVPT